MRKSFEKFMTVFLREQRIKGFNIARKKSIGMLILLKIADLFFSLSFYHFYQINIS